MVQGCKRIGLHGTPDPQKCGQFLRHEWHLQLTISAKGAFVYLCHLLALEFALVMMLEPASHKVVQPNISTLKEHTPPRRCSQEVIYV